MQTIVTSHAGLLCQYFRSTLYTQALSYRCGIYNISLSVNVIKVIPKFPRNNGKPHFNLSVAQQLSINVILMQHIRELHLHFCHEPLEPLWDYSEHVLNCLDTTVSPSTGCLRFPLLQTVREKRHDLDNKTANSLVFFIFAFDC